MAYDETLAERIRSALRDAAELQEKKMFGGIGFLFRGNMACAVNGNNLIVRTGPERYAEALAQPYVRFFDMTGRPMSGWVLVEAEGLRDEDALREWLRWALDYTGQLPAKSSSKR